ncbi:hypothetical protein HHL28_00810 [Aerophototrophica crusticola]|uniref:Uncharacterized protein n=1 Tax=Aerophototrophica crusticola TaxID=1709002 RepID=A0A858R377_9PROT|nr:hypothetical protein HHL28_00810 [Rhodospirillaceae bacterium B3]
MSNRTADEPAMLPTLSRSLFLAATALLAGAVAGLWDLSAAELEGTLLILGLSGFGLGLVAPRGAPLLALAVAAGVLGAHLASPVPPGAQLSPLESGLISAAVAALPAGIGAGLGALFSGSARRLVVR